MHESAGSCSEWNPTSADMRDTQGHLPGALSPTYWGPRSFSHGADVGPQEGGCFAIAPGLLLQSRTVSTDVQKSFALQGWIPSHSPLSWWALPDSTQLSVHCAGWLPFQPGFPFTVLAPLSENNGQPAGLQLFSCKVDYFLLWEKLLFGVSATTVTSVLIPKQYIHHILPCKIKQKT